mmetsp:Transcript_17083/g.41350  ORF Transcript_17083/g.41350 Transcript_17083/m.41350 type:complete len:310 (-) Transcript_17083:115-1044(-)
MHDLPLAVDEVYVLDGHACGVEKAHELVHHDRNLVVDLEDRLVAHVERSHQLQHWDLEREVEGGNDRHWAIGPAVALRHLSLVIAGHSKRARQESHLVSGVVLEELARHDHLALGLRIALRGHALDEAREEVLRLRVRHHLRGFGGDGSVLKVALDLVERVVLAVLGALEQAINVRVQAVLQHLRALDEDLTRKRIQNLGDRTSRAPNPFAVHDVVHLAGLLGAERFRIHGSKARSPHGDARQFLLLPSQLSMGPRILRVGVGRHVVRPSRRSGGDLGRLRVGMDLPHSETRLRKHPRASRARAHAHRS